LAIAGRSSTTTESIHEDYSSHYDPTHIGPLPTSCSNAAAYRTNQHPFAHCHNG